MKFNGGGCLDLVQLTAFIVFRKYVQYVHHSVVDNNLSTKLKTSEKSENDIKFSARSYTYKYIKVLALQRS